MTNQLPTDSQMTDVFGRFPTSLPPVNKDSETKISNRNKVLLGTAAVLLGGGAAFAAINFEDISALVEGGEVPMKGETPGGVKSEVSGESGGTDMPGKTNSALASVRHHAASAVQNGTITPNENIIIAGQVEEQMTFGQAYAAARQETGPGGIFSWHGQVYNTYTVEEWQGLSLGQRQEFLSDVGYRPSSVPTIAEPPIGIPVEPAYIELVINGRPALGIDDDHDGIADAIVVIDEESDSLFAFVDAGGDDRIDTAVQFDPFSQQIVGQQAIEQPFLVEMNRLEAMSDWNEPHPLPYDVALVADDEGTFDYDDDNDYTDDDGYVNDAELPDMD